MKTTSLSLVFLFLCFGFAYATDKMLSDKEARTLIENLNKKTMSTSIQLGNVSMKADTLKKYKAWEAAGIVQLINEKDLTKEFTGWNDFLKSTQYGVKGEAKILLTDLGKKVNLSSDTNFVTISAGSSQITKITDIDTLKRDFDQYCLVTGLTQVEWTPEYKQMLHHLNGNNPSNSRKFRALFKHDKIKDQWQILAYDGGDAEGEFLTNNVKKYLDDPK